MGVPVNYFAVLVAGIVSMGVGFLWYGPILGKVWIKEKGYSKEDLKREQKKMGPYYGISFVLALLTAYVLTHVMVMGQSYFKTPTFVASGLSSAFWMWLGFVMPVQATAQIFSEKNWKLLGIDSGHQLVSLLSMGIVIGLMGQ